jgi:hypothetical protein
MFLSCILLYVIKIEIKKKNHLHKLYKTLFKNQIFMIRLTARKNTISCRKNVLVIIILPLTKVRLIKFNNYNYKICKHYSITDIIVYL